MGHSFLSDPTNTYYFGYSSYKQPSRECPSSTYYLMSDSQVLLLLRLQLHFSVQDNRRFRWFWLDSRCQIERSKRRKFFIFHSSSIGSDHKHTHKSDRSVRQHSVQSEDESISDFGGPLVKCFCTKLPCSYCPQIEGTVSGQMVRWWIFLCTRWQLTEIIIGPEESVVWSNGYHINCWQ